MKDYLKELGIILLAALALTVILLLISPPAKASDDLQLYADQTEAAYKLPPGLLVAICEQESRWRNVAGRHGEIGVCQIKPSTARMVCSDCAGNIHKRFIMYGSKGVEVMRIQAVLAREKLYAGEIDGVYGPLTLSALRQYQARAKIAIDGIVGPQTWKALFGAHDPFPGTTIAEALWDPHQNIEWAARILAWLRDNVSPDPMVMAAAYNGGHGNPVVRYMVQVRGRI